MRFSIVTPSFRNSAWLKLCIASVADQEGVEPEHIVQDSCSDDGTLDWLPNDPRVTAIVEKDAGMYDAVNRGFRRSTGEILAYLNCDEQYLPGALRAVNDFFEKNPGIDILFSDTVIIDPTGTYVCHRKTLLPGKFDRWIRMRTLTCSMFFKRRLLEEKGLFFDTRWKALGDYFWVMRLIEAGASMAALRSFTSVFTETGDNLALRGIGQKEREERVSMIPAHIKMLTPLLLGSYWFRALLAGVYFQKPFVYNIYTLSSPARRVAFKVNNPIVYWKGRLSVASTDLLP